MSAIVFAGGAQFAAIEQWATPVPIAALAFGTLLINCRHMLMGASLDAEDRACSRRPQRFLGFFVHGRRELGAVRAAGRR